MGDLAATFFIFGILCGLEALIKRNVWWLGMAALLFATARVCFILWKTK